MERQVLAALDSTPRRALDVARALSTDKKNVNQRLYALENQGKVRRIDGTPPLWKILDSTGDPPYLTTSRGGTTRASASSLISSPRIPELAAPGGEPHTCDGDPAALLWAQQCADAVWSAFNSVKPDVTGKQVVAGFVLRHAGTPRVVALGSGTRFASGNRLSLEGRVVHDSHAEVVARRGLLRWLYAELKNAGTSSSVAMISAAGDYPFALLPTLELWLYVSLAPCGDSAIFSQVDPGSVATVPGATWSNPKHGALRTKIEAGQGTLPVDAESVQTLDGLQRGERLRSHSCSDKIAKWAVAGLQGALLSRLVGPVYLSGVVVGDLFAHGHLCRALCCRSQRAMESAAVVLHSPYRLRHVQVLHAPSGSEARHEQIQKTCRFSMNWAEHDAVAELADCVTGMKPDGSPTRIAKASLFASFCHILPKGASVSYVQNKACAVAYQEAKRAWMEAMAASKFGHWICKPCEISEFTCVSSKCLFSRLPSS